jgi:hypothetical protein
MKKRAASILIFVVLMSGCADILGYEIEVPGHWRASTPARIDLNLTYVPNAIFGSGTVIAPEGTIGFVGGNMIGDSVELMFATQYGLGARFDGKFTGKNEIKGRLNGSGFSNVGVTL